MQDEKPTYQQVMGHAMPCHAILQRIVYRIVSSSMSPPIQVEAMLKARPSSKMNMGLFDRLKEEYEWSERSLKNGPPRK